MTQRGGGSSRLDQHGDIKINLAIGKLGRYTRNYAADVIVADHLTIIHFEHRYPEPDAAAVGHGIGAINRHFKPSVQALAFDHPGRDRCVRVLDLDPITGW
jgi:hypothetical protein